MNPATKLEMDKLKVYLKYAADLEKSQPLVSLSCKMYYTDKFVALKRKNNLSMTIGDEDKKVLLQLMDFIEKASKKPGQGREEKKKALDAFVTSVSGALDEEEKSAPKLTAEHAQQFASAADFIALLELYEKLNKTWSAKMAHYKQMSELIEKCNKEGVEVPRESPTTQIDAEKEIPKVMPPVDPGSQDKPNAGDEAKKAPDALNPSGPKTNYERISDLEFDVVDETIYKNLDQKPPSVPQQPPAAPPPPPYQPTNDVPSNNFAPPPVVPEDFPAPRPFPSIKTPDGQFPNIPPPPPAFHQRPMPAPRQPHLSQPIPHQKPQMPATQPLRPGSLPGKTATPVLELVEYALNELQFSHPQEAKKFIKQALANMD